MNLELYNMLLECGYDQKDADYMAKGSKNYEEAAARILRKNK